MANKGIRQWKECWLIYETICMGGLWLKMLNIWVKKCERCCTGEGSYNEPNTKQGPIIVNNPMDLLCIGFTTMDPSKNSEENIIIMMDAFSKFSVTVVTSDQTADTVTKALVNG